MLSKLESLKVIGVISKSVLGLFFVSAVFLLRFCLGFYVAFVNKFAQNWPQGLAACLNIIFKIRIEFKPNKLN